GLPPNWYAYTNLDLAMAPGTSREIDVIIVAEDRILLVDIKEWKGPIESREGRWLNNGRDSGLVTVLCRSPISLCHLGFERERADAAQI
ncbi:MAG: nuclease-related domain-containing protein, partial [Pseudomonas graminis]